MSRGCAGDRMRSLAGLQETLLSRIYARGHYLLASLLVAEMLVFLYYGRVHGDEGWYLYASRLVFDGDVPYRDFPYFQGPVFPYLYGLPQVLLGPSFLVGRVTSLAFTLTAILTIAYLAHRLGGRASLLWALALVFLNPVLMRYCTLARPDAAVTSLSLLALAALLRFRQGTLALTAAPALLLLASGMRISFVPAFLGVLAFVLWTSRATRGQRLLAGGFLLSEALVVFGILISLAPQRAVFNLWSSQVSRAGQFAPSDPSPGATFLDKVVQLESLWSWYLMVLVPAVALAAYIVMRYYQGWQPRRAHFGGRPLDSHLLIFGLALLIFAPHVLASSILQYYFLPSSALLTVAVATAPVHLGTSADLRAVRSLVLPLLIALVLLGAPSYAARATTFLDVRDPDLVEFGDAGDLVASYLDDDEPFVALDLTLAVAANRPVIPGLEMGQLSYWPGFSTEKAERLGVFNRELLVQTIALDPPRVVALTDFDLARMALTTPRDLLGSEDEERPFRVLPELKQWYSLMSVVPQYTPFTGRLYILVRHAPESGALNHHKAPGSWQ